jgi:signal transduction histidine kinase/ActR/RegA family two-component response regulator
MLGVAMDRTPRLPGSLLRAADSPRRFLLAAMLPALIVCALMAYWLAVLHEHRIQFTDRQVQLQTAAVAEHADVVLRMIDGSLKHIVADLRNDRLDPANAGLALQRRVNGDPYLRALRLVDADGRVLASSGASFVRGHAMELVRAADGNPHGVAGAVAMVDSRFVTDVFVRLAFEPDARIGLYRANGERLGGDLDLAPLVGPAREPAALLAAMLKSGRTAVHGPMFAAARQLDGLPLIVVAARDRDAVMASWWRSVAGAAIVTLLVLALLLLLLQRLESERRARLQAQSALDATRERTRLAFEAAQQRTRRLESLGRFAGGIAHDFNNVLVAIVGYAELLQQQLAPGSAAARQAEQVLRAGERGRDLVARILSFSRGGVRSLSSVALEPVVDEALDRLAATLPPTVRLERERLATDASVLADAPQLVDAIHNLCMNAVHAMPAGGSLRVGVARLHVEAARTVSHGSLAPGDYACLEIADTGIGMDSDVLEHLFEPFFTTRADTGGTGLGLAMAHAAVREARGTIDVASAPGRGSRFRLYLPLQGAVAPAAPRGCGQVVLVVDDEPALVALTEELLAGLGYEAVGFHDPLQALAAWRAQPERFEAVLTDQRMPALSGSALARELHATRPELPILLVSAHADAELAAAALDPAIVVLQKPLQQDELARQLDRMFARHALAA